LVLSPDGTRLVSTSDDRTGRIWNTRTGSAVATLEGHMLSSKVVAMSFSWDGSRIISHSYNGMNQLSWDATTGLLIPGQMAPQTPFQQPNSLYRCDLRTGWLTLLRNASPIRLCWIPFDRRPSAPIVSWKDRIAFGSATGIVTILNCDIWCPLSHDITFIRS
jgi:WD40 repeat protein